MRVAVIGSGIAGLAAAYYLSRKHEVHLFEKDGRLGGHTNTVLVDGPEGPVPVDTGFIVHNDRTYPNLVRLFAEIKAAGYAGGYTQLKEFVRAVRPRPPADPVVRFETEPGHQAQVDFAEFRLP